MTTYAEHGAPDYNSKTAAGCEAAGEPVFLLRAQDIHAADAVRGWAGSVAESQGPGNDIVIEALRIADTMDAWAVKKEPD